MAESRKALTRFDDYFDMMSDRVRLDAYVGAIERTVKPGDVVADLGAGLGILSLIAARAGARKVYAIEKGDAAELARAIAAHNGFADVIEVIEASSLDVALPEPADVLVSETLGSFGVEENTLAFTLDARERWLAPGARMIPRAIEPWLCPVARPAHRERVRFWRDVAGFDFAPAVDELIARMHVADVEERELLAEPRPIARFDLGAIDAGTFAVRCLFVMKRAGTIEGLAGWFAAELDDEAWIRTSPSDPKTHWGQAFFPLRAPIEVVAGDVMEVTLRCEGKDARADDSSIRYDYRCTQLANE